MPEHSPGGVQFPIFSDLIKHGNSPSALADWFKALALTSDVQSNDVADAARIAAIDDATTKYGGLPQRVSDVEQKNTEQDDRLDGVEQVNTDQGTRLTNVETKNTEQDGRLDEEEANNIEQDGRLDTVEDTAIFDGDARLMDVGEVEGVFFGVVDKQDRRTALELGLDGNLTNQSATRIGSSLGISTVKLDSGPAFAIVDADDRIIFTPGTTDSNDSLALPTANWAHWGDSLTDDEVTGTQAWTVQLAALTGQDHFNGGWYSQSHEQIAARQGGLPALVTIAGNATAASGASVVTSIANSPVLYSLTRTVRGTLNGIVGTLAEATSGNVTFTPDAAGIYAVPAKSRFTPADGTSCRDRITTIWAGRNGYLTVPVQESIASTQAMIDYLSSNVKRVIVMEIPPSDTNPIGGAGRAELDAYNAARRAAFPAYWDDTATWLRGDAAATAAGIAWTAQDQTDIANGITPVSFRSDYIHFNATGCTAIAHRVHQIAQERGWL